MLLSLDEFHPHDPPWGLRHQLLDSQLHPVERKDYLEETNLEPTKALILVQIGTPPSEVTYIRSTMTPQGRGQIEDLLEENQDIHFQHK